MSQPKKPLGWVLVNNGGDIVPWHPEVKLTDPTVGGFSRFPDRADKAEPDGAPHRWQAVVAAPEMKAETNGWTPTPETADDTEGGEE